MRGGNEAVLFCIFSIIGPDISAAPVISALTMPFADLVTMCAPDIHPTTFAGIVATESAFNPYAIGVVGGRIKRLPKTREEAISTANSLERQGYNFSLGLTQVNRSNLALVGETYETIFEPCRNIRAGALILKDCYSRANKRFPDAQQAIRGALSCYYSGNFTRGFKPDREGEPSYVQKVIDTALHKKMEKMVVPAIAKLNSGNSVNQDSTNITSTSPPIASLTTASSTAKPAWGKYSDDTHTEKQNALSDDDTIPRAKSSPSWGIFEDSISTFKNTTGGEPPPVKIILRRNTEPVGPEGW